MSELLLPRLKQEIEARLAELRPLIAEVEQLEAAKAALLARSDLAPTASARPSRRRAARNGSSGAGRPRRAASDGGDGGRAPHGANHDAILQLVEERPGVSVAEIASVTKIAKPTVATTVSKLKRDGVLADEAGGVKLASRQPLTLAGPGEAEAERRDGSSDAEWEAAEPAKDEAGTAA
jgi:winged helix-turn-helix DNA-binding protein